MFKNIIVIGGEQTCEKEKETDQCKEYKMKTNTRRAAMKECVAERIENETTE